MSRRCRSLAAAALKAMEVEIELIRLPDDLRFGRATPPVSLRDLINQPRLARVRPFVRDGTSERVAMQLSGHKTGPSSIATTSSAGLISTTLRANSTPQNGAKLSRRAGPVVAHVHCNPPADSGHAGGSGSDASEYLTTQTRPYAF